MTSLLARLKSSTPKRILTLDGGGVRGLISLGFLARIEALLRERSGRPDFRLCEYFDLISGTSTGAIIATCLALGFSVEEVTEGYHRLARRVFGKQRWRRWTATYDERPLLGELTEAFGNRTLGDDSLKTGLCLMLKRADTNSLWPLLNHPDGTYYPLNRGIRLKDAVRASTAAPTLFLPQILDVGNLEQAAFIDGAVSMANNPAWHTLLAATLKGYPFHWPTGENQLLLTSIGTGRRIWKETPQRIGGFWLLNWAREVPRMLIDDAGMQVQLMLQAVSRSPTAIQIDSEIGDLSQDLLTPEPLLHYLRYDVELSQAEFLKLGMSLSPEDIARLSDLAGVQNIPRLAEAGRLAAAQQVLPAHFPAAFDLPPKKSVEAT